MTQFEKITQTPETLAAFLSSLPVIDGPWDTEFHARYCADCLYLGCDIIDTATWEQVQKLREGTKRRKPKNTEKNMFAGLLYCANCGHKLH